MIAAARASAAHRAQVGLAWLLHHAPTSCSSPARPTPVTSRRTSPRALTLDEATLAALDAVPPRSGDIALG